MASRRPWGWCINDGVVRQEVVEAVHVHGVSPLPMVIEREDRCE